MTELDSKYLALWAKSPEKNESFDPHPVIAHLLDVAASAYEVLKLEPKKTLALYASDFGLAEDETIAWVCALAGLHDLGKVSPAFQQLWIPGLARLLETAPEFNWRGTDLKAPSPPPNYVFHSLISQVVLPNLLAERGFSEGLAASIADAVGCHHGFRAEGNELTKANRKSEKGRDVWEEARKALFEVVLSTVGVGSAPAVKRLSPAAFMRLAGLTSFADWIGSSLYPKLQLAGFETDLRSYFEEARRAARERLSELGWTKRSPLVRDERPLEDVFAYLTREDGKPFTPRPLQKEVKKLLREPLAPTLLLIEAPMGEGKTEAAFYAHLRLQAELDHRGLYVALPTMATGNAMFSRTARFLNEQAEGRTVPLDLQLLHGATELNEQYTSLQAKVRANLPSEDRRVETLEHVQAREFFTHKKQALLSEYGVGTVDQALLTILNIRHQFVRLWGLGNRVVVIDEVHAYDTYTSELVKWLVRWLYELGSSVVLLSATLSKKSRGELLKAYGGEDKSTEKYPRIFKVSAGETELVPFEADASRRTDLALHKFSADLNAIVRLLEQNLVNGGCAVCIVNTVDRAQELYKKLQGFETYLFHARFPAEARADIEKSVLERFGKDASRENGKRPHKAVLVATQVVEQSLDLDFDLMVTDLAPVDLIIQRAGRMWRHKRPPSERPIPKPQLFVAGMAHEEELPNLAPHYWDKVYQPYILYKTWEVLRDQDRLVLPDHIDGLVQRVYDGAPVGVELSPEALEKMKADQTSFEKENTVDENDGKGVVISQVRKNGTLSLREPEVTRVREEDDKPNRRPLVQTRKGPPSITVIPLFEISGSYFLDADAQRPYERKKPLETFKRSVRLSRRGLPPELEKHNAASGIDRVFEHWSKEPLLQNCVPLVLNAAGYIEVSKTKIKLDEVLGIVYERA